MSLTVFLAVLGAALLHATWNALVRIGSARMASMVMLTLVQGIFGAVMALNFPWPAAHVWPWLLASGLIHTAYKLFLTFAYEQGDLSRVYPIARGTAPLLVLAVGLVFLPDEITLLEAGGVALLGVGILAMARGVFTHGESVRLLPFAFGSAVSTAGYTLVDGTGARLAEAAMQYVAWLFVLDALSLTTAALYLRGRAVLTAPARAWAVGSVAGLASYGAYAVAVWGMTKAPIALVAALRETSILFAVLIGWLAFGERLDGGKAVAAVLIVGGVILTRV